jgi:hypothetical protein
LANDYFGNAVSSRLDVVVVGAMSHDTNGFIDAGIDICGLFVTSAFLFGQGLSIFMNLIRGVSGAKERE